MIDFTPILDVVLPLLGAAITSALAYYARKMGQRYDWLDAETAAHTVEDYVNKGIRIVRGQLDSQHNITDNETISRITQWVLDHTPKALKAAGLTSDDIEGMVRDWLRDG